MSFHLHHNFTLLSTVVKNEHEFLYIGTSKYVMQMFFALFFLQMMRT